MRWAVLAIGCLAVGILSQDVCHQLQPVLVELEAG